MHRQTSIANTDINFLVYSSSFGMLMPGRSFSGSDKYSYGFQGQLLDDEIKGENNSVNYKYRMHDPRVGRFFAVDPLTHQYPHYTPYSFSGNKVIAWAELEGLEEIMVIIDQVSLGVFDQYYIWDVTARARGERGKIQYYDVQSGTFSVMRNTTLEERNNDYIRTSILANEGPDPKGSTSDSPIANSYGIQRTDEKGNLVNYQQTKERVDKTNGKVGVLGEGHKTFDDNVKYEGVTAVNYSLGGGTGAMNFNNATNAQRNAWVQPSASLQADLISIAADYLSGNAIDITVKINTNRVSTTPGIQLSNDMRRDAIVNFLVARGVDRSAIKTPAHAYPATDNFGGSWSSEITVDEAQ